jgi:hypothetical protein
MISDEVGAYLVHAPDNRITAKPGEKVGLKDDEKRHVDYSGYEGYTRY